MTDHHPECEAWMGDWRERAHAAEAENEHLRGVLQIIADETVDSIVLARAKAALGDHLDRARR